MISKDDILRRLTELNISQTTYEHPPVMTSADLANVPELAGVDGANVKNLFLKDRKSRLYLISKLESTSCDLKVMAKRLGLPKDSLRMAPAELLPEVLGVPLGSATPLALANPSASSVVLLLDARFQQQQHLLVHPLTNTATTAITPAGLEAFLRAIDREPMYVELYANPTVDAEHPPDLKHLTDAAEPSVSAAHGDASAASAQPTASAQQNGMAPISAKQSPAAKLPQPSAQGNPQATDVAFITNNILSKVSAAYGESGKGLGDTAARTLAADIEMQLNALRNAAYAKGVTATRGQFTTFAEVPFRCL